ncbi:MAG TPA: cob(I)yrinic acid a,c-diamide adenosyltransferase [Verrucomicrobia bacterium]|nr:cob(I)yrinic acid a,c-diamide adenosyltransferase [Verrucomicrobiota bacterium]
MNDDGSTPLPGLGRLSKSDVLFDALGALDELNAVLGLLRAHPGAQPHANRLESIQRDILLIGSELATGRPQLEASAVAALDREIERLNGKRPPLRHFILPGESETSARAHMARAFCRRAERDLVRAQETHPDRIPPPALAYLNRLSSLLFALACSF